MILFDGFKSLLDIVISYYCLNFFENVMLNQEMSMADTVNLLYKYRK